jgi:hypothetical protein
MPVPPASRTLSEQESRLLSSLSAERYTVFTIEETRAIVDNPDVVTADALP